MPHRPDDRLTTPMDGEIICQSRRRGDAAGCRAIIEVGRELIEQKKPLGHGNFPALDRCRFWDGKERGRQLHQCCKCLWHQTSNHWKFGPNRSLRSCCAVNAARSPRANRRPRCQGREGNAPRPTHSRRLVQTSFAPRVDVIENHKHSASKRRLSG